MEILSKEELEIQELELEARIASLKLEVKKLEVSYRKNRIMFDVLIRELSKRGILSANDLKEIDRLRKVAKNSNQPICRDLENGYLTSTFKGQDVLSSEVSKCGGELSTY